MSDYQFKTVFWIVWMVFSVILSSVLIGIPMLLMGIAGPLYYQFGEETDINHIKKTGFFTLVREMLMSGLSLVGGIVFMGILLAAAAVPILFLLIAAGLILYGILRPLSFLGIKLFYKTPHRPNTSTYQNNTPQQNTNSYGYSRGQHNVRANQQSGSQESFKHNRFCGNCGTKVEGKFCISCGVPAT